MDTPPANPLSVGGAYRAMVAAATNPSATAAAAVRLGEALRKLQHVVVGTDAPDDVLERVADEVERLGDELQPHAAASRYGQAQRLSERGTFLNHPMIGPANPCSPPIVMHPDRDGLAGAVVFRTPQEGPPDCVYGGYIAAGFDAVLLMTAGINGVGGPTRSLTVRYRHPVPIHTTLRYEGAIESVEERNTRVRGRLLAGDLVCAEGVADVALGRTIGSR
jgi:hypothetical protein